VELVPRDRKEGEVNVLVAYASRHGSTVGIAERVAEGLQAAGMEAEARPVGDVGDLGSYDAVVIGAAAYLFHWLKEATRFVRRNRDELVRRPVWLFSSGPLGTDLVDEEGRDVLETARPKEFDELRELIHPRGEQVFFGAWNPDAAPIGVVERAMRHLPASDATPAGDFRDWDAIDAWTAGIARELQAHQATGA
jgi:menaquinone-dependent protoporphyrinogen oxidase